MWLLPICFNRVLEVVWRFDALFHVFLSGLCFYWGLRCASSQDRTAETVQRWGLVLLRVESIAISAGHFLASVPS
jgi:hypothetical protein